MKVYVASSTTLYPMSRSHWLRELREAQKRERVLVPEERPARLPSDREQCVVCNKRTHLWLLPENAPLCGDECLQVYLQDPTVYDPRELYTRPSPRLVPPVKRTETRSDPGPKRATRRRPGRWEPSETEIRQMQERIAKRLRGEQDE